MGLLALCVAAAGCASERAALAYREDGLVQEAPRAEPMAMNRQAPAPMVMAESISADSDGGGGDAGLFAFMSDDASGKIAMAPPPPATAPPPSAQPLPGADPMSTKPAAPTSKRLLIYSGSLSVVVPVVEDEVKKLVAMVEGMGGYLQNQNDGVVTLRIPATVFFAVIDSIKKNGKVTSENLSTNDVTAQVFDIELRLQTAEESRKRLLELLRNAQKTEDLLNIEREVRRLTEEIESMKGQLRVLRDQVSFSTLTVQFFANAAPPTPYPQQKPSRFPWVNAVGIEQVLYGF
jgi:hypothetical protein